MTMMRRMLMGLCCGALAIDVNSAMLAGADFIGLRTAHGGLLRLLQLLAAVMPGSFGATFVRATSGAAFQFAFHIVVGLGMAVFYVVVVRGLHPRSPWVTALAYAGVLWVLNAAVVLPLIGEGFAGSHHLTLAGIIGYAIAHTVFFVVLAFLVAFFSQEVRETEA